MGWFENKVRAIARSVARGEEVAVQDHEISSTCVRQYQIWEIENGFLLVEYGGGQNPQYNNSAKPSSYYPDLKSLYEGLVTKRTRDKLGMGEEPADAVTTATSSWGAVGTATSGPVKI